MVRDEKYILAIDEGTSSAKAFVVDDSGSIAGRGQYELEQHFPKPGWVEHNPEEIWNSQMKAVKQAIEAAYIDKEQIASIGITNQRETTILWDKSGKPVHNAIVWQDRRTSEIIDSLSDGERELIKERTGLIADSYFSASKIKWMLDTGLRKRAEKGEILFGTVDSYLIYRLTDGKVHATDVTNASRTMLFDIKKMSWDSELLEIFGIPDAILPEIRQSGDFYGTAEKIYPKIPISSCMGDQQAALFGQACFKRGMVKNTYGTGNFILMNTGGVVRSEKLLTTPAWSVGGRVEYALEGSVFATGSAIQWVKDGLKMAGSMEEMEKMASSLKDNGGVYLVPAFVGLGAPYWNQYARGTVVGMSRGTGAAHLARAALEAVAYLSNDVLGVMEEESGLRVGALRVDGGASENEFLMQFQSDISGCRILKARTSETTAMGAACMAGMEIGLWKKDDIAGMWMAEREYEPSMDAGKRSALVNGWKRAVERSLNWASEEFA
ncbi:MAG TPA: glycerol kinase [Thermoplasmatales archaeon]|nr:glycerol kinase [Thermoplasmatales archaeon]